MSRYRLRVATLYLVLMFSSVGSIGAAVLDSIRNIPPTAHDAPPGTPLADIAEAIKAAADDEGWTITIEEPGLMHASLLIRRHSASVIIRYDESNYSIDYEDSINLNYRPDDYAGRRNMRVVMKGPRIHSNYNVWVDRFAKRIEMVAMHPPKAKPRTSNPLFVADELEKLAGLLRQGLLSREEFDRQKAKLLAQ